ncbi:hypothetical protein ACJJTC_018054 [Scirpophaga incertulas]
MQLEVRTDDDDDTVGNTARFLVSVVLCELSTSGGDTGAQAHLIQTPSSAHVLQHTQHKVACIDVSNAINNTRDRALLNTYLNNSSGCRIVADIDLLLASLGNSLSPVRIGFVILEA